MKPQQGFFYGSLAWCGVWALAMVALAVPSPAWWWMYLICAGIHMTCARIIWVSRDEEEGVE